MGRVDIDVNELVVWDAALGRAPAVVVTAVKGVVRKGALSIKRDAARRAGGLKHAPAYPRSIGYDVAETATAIEATIGPDKDKPQGALGNILEFGTVKNPPHPHLGPALDAEAPQVQDWIGLAAAEALEGRR